MSEIIKDIVIPITPDVAPSPTPTPAPVVPAKRIDPATVTKIVTTLLTLLSTAANLSKGQLGDTLKKILAFVEGFAKEPWFTAALAEVCDLISGNASLTIEEIIQVISSIFLKHATAPK